MANYYNTRQSMICWVIVSEILNTRKTSHIVLTLVVPFLCTISLTHVVPLMYCFSPFPICRMPPIHAFQSTWRLLCTLLLMYPPRPAGSLLCASLHQIHSVPLMHHPQSSRHPSHYLWSMWCFLCTLSDLYSTSLAPPLTVFFGV